MSEDIVRDPRIQAVLAEKNIRPYDHFLLPALASFLDIDEATAKRMVRRGQIQRIKVGKSVRFPGWVIAKALAYGVPEFKAWDGVERRTRQQPFEGIERRKVG